MLFEGCVTYLGAVLFNISVPQCDTNSVGEGKGGYFLAHWRTVLFTVNKVDDNQGCTVRRTSRSLKILSY